MSDLDSDASLPLPASPEDDDSHVGHRRKLSIESDSGIDKIPEPQPSQALPLLEEIPYPSDMDKEDMEQDIPLPPDSSKYSPSQAIVADDDTEVNISPAQSSETSSANILETSKPKMHVLGKEQAKKRLAAFSAAKMASAAAATSKKTTAVKGITVFHQSSKSKSSQENLAIASIKQEEEKMKEVMALNSILSEKLKQVSVISTSIPKPPPVTAVVIPTVINPDSISIRTDIPVADIAIESKVDDAGGFTKKSSSLVAARNIRSKRESSSSRSRSRSHSKSESPVDTRKVRDRRSRERRSRSKDRRSRSRERKRSKERVSRSRSDDKYSRNRDKRSRSKERRSRSRDRNKRSRSRERRSRSRDRGRARRRSRSRDRRSRSKEKSRGKRDKGEHKSSRKSKSRSPSPVKKKDKRRSRSKSPTKSKKKDKKSRNSRSRSKSREREIRERKKERDQREKERKEKESVEREKREKERKEAQRKRELEEELERELDKVRRSRMPNDWQDFGKFQYKYEHIQRLWSQMTKLDTKRARSDSRSSDESESKSTSKSKEILQPTPLSLGLQQPLKAMSTVSVELSNGSTADYPADLVKKTTVQPSLTYGSNPRSFAGYYKTREQAFKVETSDVARAMSEIVSGKSADQGAAEANKCQQWFATNEMTFCPSDGSKGVLISHLYSDDMEDSPSESSRPMLDTTTAKKPVISSVRSDTKSKSSEETDPEQDSMDSAPSPLLKKKYEHEDKPQRMVDDRVRNGDKEKRDRDSSHSSLEDSDVDEYKSRSKGQTVEKIEDKVSKRVSKREDASPAERILVTKDKPAKGKQDSDDEYLEEMDVDFQLEKEKPTSTNVKDGQNQTGQEKEKPKEDTKDKDKKRKDKDKKDKKQKKKKRHHKVSKKKSRESSADGNSSSDDEQSKPKKADVEKPPAPKSDVTSEVKPSEAKQKHHSKKKRDDRKGSVDSKHSSDEETDDSAKRQPKRKRSKLATTKEDEGNSKEKAEEPKTSATKRSERSRSRSPDRKHKKSKDKKAKKKKSESKQRHKKKHSKKSRAHSTSSASSDTDKHSSSRSSSSSSSSDDSDTDSKRKHKKKKDSEGDKADKKKDDKNKKDKGGGGASGRRGAEGGTSHSRDNDHKDRSRKDRDSHDHRRDKDRHRRHSGGRKRISYEELMEELTNNPLGSNGDIDISTSVDEQDPEKIVASLLSNIDVPNIQNHVDTFATTALISELDDDEILKSVLQNEDINIDILLKSTSTSGTDEAKSSRSKSSSKKRISSSWSDDSQDYEMFKVSELSGLLSSGYGTEKSTGTDVDKESNVVVKNNSDSSDSSSDSGDSSSSSSSSDSSSSSSSDSDSSAETDNESDVDSKQTLQQPEVAGLTQLTDAVPSKLYDPFRESSESDTEESKKAKVAAGDLKVDVKVVDLPIDESHPKGRKTETSQELHVRGTTLKGNTENDITTITNELFEGKDVKSIPTIPQAMPIPTLLSTGFASYSVTPSISSETVRTATVVKCESDTDKKLAHGKDSAKKEERRRSRSRSLSGSSRSRSRSYSPHDKSDYYDSHGRRRHRSDSYERPRDCEERRRRSPSPRARFYNSRSRHREDQRSRDREYDRHRRRRSRSRSRSKSRSRSPSPRSSSRFHYRNRWREDSSSSRRHRHRSDRGSKFEHEFESSPAGFSSPQEDYRGRRRREFEEILQKEGFGVGPTEIKTDSPPLQLNVADSTISDSELAATGVSGVLAAAGDIFGGISKEALFEHNQHMHANSQSMYFYPPHPAQQPEGATELDCAETNLSYSQNDDTPDTDTLEYPSSPKRLSLDERLEKEMGIHLHEEPTKLSLTARQSVLGPLFPKSGEGSSKGKLSNPWNSGQKQSQVMQVGNMIQVVPAELPNNVTITAADVSKSQSKKKTDSQDSESAQGQSGASEMARRVVTIKVPVVPFKVPILPISDIAVQPSATHKVRKSKKPKRKKKTLTIKSREDIKVIDESGTQDQMGDMEMKTKPEMEQEKSISKETTTSDGESKEKESNTESDTPKSNVREHSETDDMKDADEREECVPNEESKDGNKVENLEEKPNISPIPKTPTHLLYPARGILVSAGFRERTVERARGVTFRDGINPGDGTSSSGGEEMGSPPPPSTATPAQGAKKVRIRRKKKVKVKAQKLKEENSEDDSAERPPSLPPPPIPNVPYPYCPPGILYQVNLPYAVVYAQAVAEKGFDIVFQPSDQMPTIGDQPCEAIQPSTPEHQPISLSFLTESEINLPVSVSKSYVSDVSPKPNSPVPTTFMKSLQSHIAPKRLDPPVKEIPPTEGLRIPTIIRGAGSSSFSNVPTNVSYDCNYLEHMAYEISLNELHTTPPSVLTPKEDCSDYGDINKIIPVIGHGSPSMSLVRHKPKVSHPINTNIVEVPTIDFFGHSPVQHHPNVKELSIDMNTIPDHL